MLLGAYPVGSPRYHCTQQNTALNRDLNSTGMSISTLMLSYTLYTMYLQYYFVQHPSSRHKSIATNKVNNTYT